VARRCKKLHICQNLALAPVQPPLKIKSLRSVDAPSQWPTKCKASVGAVLRGGGYLKLFRLGLAVAVMLFAASVSSADGVDPRQGVGTAGGGSPPCSDFLYSADGTGAIPTGTDCLESSNTYAIEVFAPGSATLSVYSPLLDTPTVDTPSAKINQWADALLATTDLVWSETCGPTTVAGAPAEECTLTAPKIDTLNDLAVIAALSAAGLLNDGDCDEDDDILYVPAGCDVIFTTGSLGTSEDLQGDTPDELFKPFETLGATNGTPLVAFPEPGSLGLLAIGLGGLGAFRRKFSS